MHRSERSTISGRNLKNSRASWKALKKFDKMAQRVFFGKPRSAGKRKSHVECTNESISNQGLRGLLPNFRLLFSLHSRIPTNEALPELVIEYLRPHLE